MIFDRTNFYLIKANKDLQFIQMLILIKIIKYSNLNWYINSC